MANEDIAPYSGAEVQAATDQALATLLWVSTTEDGTPLDQEYTTEDFAPQMIKGMHKLIDSFMTENLEILVKSGHVAGWGNDMGKVEQIGHDYVLTTGGHGAGFWDRGLGELGDKLTEACKAESHEWCVFPLDDGKLWCDDLQGYDAGDGHAQEGVEAIAKAYGWTVGAGWGDSYKNLHVYKAGMRTLHIGLNEDGTVDTVGVVHKPGDPSSLRPVNFPNPDGPEFQVTALVAFVSHALSADLLNPTTDEEDDK